MSLGGQDENPRCDFAEEDDPTFLELALRWDCMKGALEAPISLS